MPAPVDLKPEKLTKGKLVKILKENGVTPPEGLLKTELVDFYRETLLTKKFGFSSDEDEEPVVRITRSKEARKSNVRVKLQRLEDEKMTVDGVEVSELSDQQLREELTLRGFDIGPIGPTTRLVYERRLEKALQTAGSGDAPGTAHEEYSDQDSASEEEEEEEVVVVEPPKTRNKRLSPLLRSQERGGSATRRRPMRSETKEEETVVKQVKESVKNEVKPDAPVRSERRWKPVLISFVIVMLVVAFLYFVFISMEPNPKRKLPGV